jgi:mannosyltransferase OCH1-like enzyme
MCLYSSLISGLGWEVIIWDDEKIKNQINIPHRLKSYCNDDNMKPAFKVDILRYLVLNQIGGMYHGHVNLIIVI